MANHSHQNTELPEAVSPLESDMQGWNNVISS